MAYELLSHSRKPNKGGLGFWGGGGGESPSNSGEERRFRFRIFLKKITGAYAYYGPEINICSKHNCSRIFEVA